METRGPMKSAEALLEETLLQRKEIQRLQIKNNCLRLELKSLKAWPDYGTSEVFDD